MKLFNYLVLCFGLLNSAYACDPQNEDLFASVIITSSQSNAQTNVNDSMIGSFALPPSVTPTIIAEGNNDIEASQILTAAEVSTIFGQNIPNNLECTSVYYNFRAVRNAVRSAWGSFGKRMAPSELADKLNNLTASYAWVNSSDKYQFGTTGMRPIYKTHTQANGKKVILSAPTHDLDIYDEKNTDHKIACCGQLSIIDSLTSILKSKGDLQILIPVAQSRNYGSALYDGDRRHWTLLMLERSNGLLNAKHIDSKGFSSAVYSLRHMLDFLTNFNCNKFEAAYLGHQGLLNNDDCGRFVGSYILHVLQGKDPYNAATKNITDVFKLMN